MVSDCPTNLAAMCLEHCRIISGFTDVPGATTRTYLSDATRGCYDYVAQIMRALDMSVQVDAAGNLRGIYSASQPDPPRLVIGSHLDTVPNAGAYDGILGVVIGIALVEALNGTRLPFEIEVIGFAEEEGVRFGCPFIGSRAFTGGLDSSLLNRRDDSGVSVAEAMDRFGLDRRRLSEAVFDPRFAGYL